MSPLRREVCDRPGILKLEINAVSVPGTNKNTRLTMVNGNIESDSSDLGDCTRARANGDIKEHHNAIVVADRHARLRTALIRIR